MTTPPTALSTTWRRKGALARWRYALPLSTDADGREALRTCLLDLIRALDGFARPTAASWTSEAAGEDALEQDLRGDPASTLSASSLEDPTDVSLSLALLYVDPAGHEHELDCAGDLWVELEPDDNQIAVQLSLDVDLYAWRSWGRERDNGATAALNAPRLRSFLERLQRDLGARIEEVDAPDYPGQVDPLGFRPPA